MRHLLVLSIFTLLGSTGYAEEITCTTPQGKIVEIKDNKVTVIDEKNISELRGVASTFFSIFSSKGLNENIKINGLSYNVFIKDKNQFSPFTDYLIVENSKNTKSLIHWNVINF